jgi:hypothetical protein
MEYRLGNSKKVYSWGETTRLICPKCAKKVKMSVFTNFETRLIAEFPLIKGSNVYFLVCPECASVFGVDATKGYTFRKGEPLAIGNYDLKELKEFDV